jgi:hypothetical protein
MSNRRIARFLVLGAALSLTLPVVANAQTSRVEGMALQGDYIKDYTGIYTYTSAVANVGNLVYGELGNLNTPPATFDRSVGAVLGNIWDGRFGTWAVHLREQTPNLGQGDAFSNPGPGDLGFDPNVHTNESFDLMWARKFGTTSFGLRLNRSFFSAEGTDLLAAGLSTLEYDFPGTGGSTSPADANLARNIMGVGAGIGFEISPTTNIELSVLYQARTYQISDTLGTTFEEDGPSTYQVAARAFWQWQPNVIVTPVFKWYSYDLSTTVTGGPAVDNSLRGWQIGAAGNWTLGSNDLFVLGATFAQNKVEQEADIFGVGFTTGTITETFMPQVFAALETHVNNWLTLRFGANKGAWHTLKLEDDATPAETEVKDSPFNMAIGAGVKVGTLQLDAILNDFWPQFGPWFLSGSTAGAMFPKVTATYSF